MAVAPRQDYASQLFLHGTVCALHVSRKGWVRMAAANAVERERRIA